MSENLLNKKGRLNDISTAELTELLSTGADERIFVDPSGYTKYGVRLIDPDLVNRGSCTCSAATSYDVELMKNALAENHSDEDWIKLKASIASDLRKNINYEGEDKFRLFFAPTGTDLLYFPILMARLLQPSKSILNIVSCIEELGSGTPFVVDGRFYSNHNQFGDKVEKGTRVFDHLDIKNVFLRARSEEGDILDNEAEISRLVKEHPDHLIIINLVYGSKSGIEDNLNLMDKIKGDHIYYNTDLCQFRHSKAIVNHLLDKMSAVMITGSKFYQSTPFSGAYLIPKPIYNELRKATEWHVVDDFAQVFSKHDFPDLIGDKLNFPAFVNKANTLRWLCATEEMKRYHAIPKKTLTSKIDLWRKVVVEEMESREAFELMPYQDYSNKTILAFRMKCGDRYLDHEELRELHQQIVRQDYSVKYGLKQVFIGQPVAFSENRSFLRLAIGAKNVREFVEADEKEFLQDRHIISIIEDQFKIFCDNKTSEYEG